MSARAWLGWAGMVALIGLAVTNPLYQAVAILGVVAVGAVAPSAPGAGALRPLLALGLGVLVFSAFVSLANGTPGESTLFTVPGPRAPSWLGGLRFGGPVTREGLILASTRALGIFAVFAAFAVVTTANTPARLLRATPAVLAEAGLVVTVGLALLPATLEDFRRLREAERLRGRDVRWWRLPTLVTPAVLSGLERAIRLAEAMEARGMGERPPGGGARLAAAAATPLALLAAYLWISGGDGRLLAIAPAIGAAGGVAWWLSTAGRSRRTTRLRPEPSRRSTIVAGALAMVAVIAVAAGPSLGLDLVYNPLLDGLIPPFTAPGAVLALLTAWPFVVLLFASPAGSEARS